MTKKLTCLVCPRGCLLEIDAHGNVTGNFCPRGIPYARQEMAAPKRMLTYALKLTNDSRMLPVRTSEPVDQKLIQEIIDYLEGLALSAPIPFNAVIVENVCGSGVNIISSRKIV